MFLNNEFKIIWISSTELEPSSKSNVSFQVGAKILNFLVFVFWLDVFPSVINT